MRRAYNFVFSGLFGVSLCVGTAQAQSAQTISYPDFSSTAGLNLNGAASATTTDGGVVLRLTPAAYGQSGSAFSTTKIQLGNANTFSTFFQFRLGNPSVPPADGFAFVVQPVSSNLGGGGGGLGYAGIRPSVAIEFDTYNNGEINDNHIGVDTNGSLQDFAIATPYGVNDCTFPQGVHGCLANGDLWSVWIDYDGVNLRVALADASTQRPDDLIVYPINIGSLLDSSNAYVGFTAGTGALWESHDIVDWQFTGTYQPIAGPASLAITPTSLPSGAVGRGYGVLMSVSGGTGPYTWNATNLPPGLSMSPSGAIGGTPSASGSFTGSIGVQDSAGGSASVSFTIVIAPGTVPLYITGNGYMGTVAIGKTPSPVTFSASGGKPPYSWSISGAPGGIGLSANGSSATVSGTPSSAGVYSFSVQVSDTQGISTGASGFLSVLGVLAPALPDATAFASYTGTVSAVGGTAPYSFVVSGLPSGLSVTSDGQFRGQPAKSGSFNLGIQVTDSGGLTATSSVSLNVKPAPALTLTGGALPAGLVNANYSQSVTASGGGPPYTYSFASGSLPGGLRFSAGGALSGTPAASGSFSFVARVTDITGGSATGNFTLTIATPPVLLTTASPLASGMVNVDYPPTSLAANGGVAPYTFSVAAGALPAGLTLSAIGNLGGTPQTAGTSSFDVTITDSVGQTGKGTLSATIRPSGPDLILSAGTLTFSLAAGTAKTPSAQTVQVQSSDVGTVLAWSASASSDWLQAAATGSTPGEFSVSLTPAALALAASDKSYGAQVTVTCTVSPCAGRNQLVNVQLNVNAAPAQLTLGATALAFSTSAAAPAAGTQTLNVANTGGVSMGIGSVKCAASWCNVTGIPGQIAAGSSADVAVTVNPAGLNSGYYWTNLTVVTSAGSATVTVTLFITANPGIILAPTGYQVSMQAGGVISAPPQSFQVTAASSTPINWTASIAQSGFVIVANTSGTASSTQPGTVNFSIDSSAAAMLAPGVYYNLIRITASGVANSPQDFVVVLNVTGATQKTQPNPSPAGLLFLTQANSSPPQQSVTLYNSSTLPQGWQASAKTTDGSGWLSVSPTTGSTVAAAPVVTSVTVDPSKLTPGIYRGAVDYAFAAIGVRSVNVTVVVQTPIAAQATPQLQSRAQCAPTKIAATSTDLVNHFSSPTAWPTPLELTVVDDCGNISNSAQIVATFSTGDPPLALTLADPQTGRYSATWTPRKVSSQVVINAQVRVTGFAPATVQLQGVVVPSGAPTVNPGAVLNLFNPLLGAPAAPGTLLQIGGTYLAAQTATSNANPLPKTLGGTLVLIGGIPAPVSSVSPGQINVEAPFELAPGQPYQVVVVANGALTTPETLQFTPTAPGLSVASAGYVTAVHQADGKAITGDSPAKPGEAISVFLTGLGLTDVKVDTGAGGPSNPPANVLSAPAVTLDSVAAITTFAGLAPGQPGVYRIDFTVPNKAASGDLPVQVTQDGVTTNTGLLPVRGQ